MKEITVPTFNDLDIRIPHSGIITERYVDSVLVDMERAGKYYIDVSIPRKALFHKAVFRSKDSLKSIAGFHTRVNAFLEKHKGHIKEYSEYSDAIEIFYDDIVTKEATPAKYYRKLWIKERAKKRSEIKKYEKYLKLQNELLGVKV